MSTEIKDSRWSPSKKVCVCLTWGFLALAIAWATGVHELLIFLGTEHYALAASALSVIAALGAVDGKSKVAEWVFGIANLVLGVCIVYGLIWGWGSIILYGEIYGVKFLVPTAPGLAVEAGVAAVIVCAAWHSKSENQKDVTDRVVVSVLGALMGTGFVLVLAICVSVIAEVESKANEEARQANRPLTQEQYTAIGGGFWRCAYNGQSRVVTCTDPSPVSDQNTR
jgi:hypothetical protein